jgi:hypothetical protein
VGWVPSIETQGEQLPLPHTVVDAPILRPDRKAKDYG